MNSKAISPMIATILLIAFTVAVGGIISVWMTGYTRTTGQSVSSATENMTACVGTYPDIISVTSTALIVTNPGIETLTNLQCLSSNGTNMTMTPTDLSPGQMSINSTWSRGTNNLISCTAICRRIGVRGECRSGQSCWVS